MKTVADIIMTITKKLGEKFPKIEIWSTDKNEDFGDKCFFIQYTTNRDGKPDFVHEYGQIRLYYFPESKKINRIELLDMQEQLSQLFLFRIFVDESFSVPVTELTFEIDDGVLVMSFDYDIYQAVDTEETLTETMKTLEVE